MSMLRMTPHAEQLIGEAVAAEQARVAAFEANLRAVIQERVEEFHRVFDEMMHAEVEAGEEHPPVRVRWSSVAPQLTEEAARWVIEDDPDFHEYDDPDRDHSPRWMNHEQDRAAYIRETIQDAIAAVPPHDVVPPEWYASVTAEQEPTAEPVDLLARL